MADSWHNFLYAAFDPAGFLSIDKLPVAFWFQVFSVKLFGYSGFSLHLPQAIEGILAVLLVYRLTQRVVGEWGGLFAGLIMAVTPASVAVDRSNLPDSCLLLILLLAAWALLRAARTGFLKWLLLSAVLVGIGFNTKMMVAYMVLPTFYLVYWWGASVKRRKRFTQLALMTVVIVLISLSWAVFVDLTPARYRPYVGDTHNNSVISLAFGITGMQRITDSGPGPSGSRPFSSNGNHSQGPDPESVRHSRPALSNRFHIARYPGLPMPDISGHGGPPGLLRLANRELAGHITWLIPLAIGGLVAFVTISPPRLQLSAIHKTVLLWLGWFATYVIVFSISGGPIHPYYLTMLAPPIAALVGIGTVYLYQAYTRGRYWMLLPIMTIFLTAIWQIKVLGYVPEWRLWLMPVLVTGMLLLAIVLLVAYVLKMPTYIHERLGIVGTVWSLGILLVCPIVWSATPVIASSGRMVPLADPDLLEYRDTTRRADDNWTGIRSLVQFLRNYGDSERFLLAVPDIHYAAPIIIDAGEAVMAYGGFMGSDPTLTGEQFADTVTAGEVRFVLLTDQGPQARVPHDVEIWVRRHGREVPRDLWQSAYPAVDHIEPPLPGWGPTSVMIGQILRHPGLTLYDCKN
ncbi:MAG: glycosyltransferase family 39 protein [Planctomycetota bacterium]